MLLSAGDWALLRKLYVFAVSQSRSVQSIYWHWLSRRRSARAHRLTAGLLIIGPGETIARASASCIYMQKVVSRSIEDCDTI